MTQEHSHQPSGPLALAAALASVAGFVDAHIYLHLTPVFVANMSGNLVHLGIFVGAEGWQEAAGSVVAIFAFLSGVIVATVHNDRQLRRTGAVRPDELLGVEAVLILLLPFLMIALRSTFTGHSNIDDYPVLIWGGFAMGLQATVLRRVGQIAVATTYGTGAIVRIGEKVALAVRRAERPTDHLRRVTIAILVLVLLSYVGGAILASTLGSSPGLLLLPGAVLVGATIVTRSTQGS